MLADGLNPRPGDSTSRRSERDLILIYLSPQAALQCMLLAL